MTALEQQIYDAFIDAPFPADGYDIYAAQTDDDYGSPTFTTAHLPGRYWHEVTPEQLRDCYAAFSYLRPDGWRHYLPALLLLASAGALAATGPTDQVSYRLVLFLHQVLFVFWLGPDIGVYMWSTKLVNPEVTPGQRVAAGRIMPVIVSISARIVAEAVAAADPR